MNYFCPVHESSVTEYLSRKGKRSAKTCYFVIGKIAIRMFAREKEMLVKGNANERMGNALFESLTEGV